MDFDYFNSHVYLVEYAAVTPLCHYQPYMLLCLISVLFYSNMNEADAQPAHVAQQKVGNHAIAHTEG